MELVAFDLEKNLQAGRGILAAIQGDVREVAVAMAFLALVFAIASGLLARDHSAGARAAVRSMLCLIILDSYDAIFLAAVRASDTLAFHLREHSGYAEGLSRWVNSLGQFMQSQDSTLDLITGVIKSGLLHNVNLVTYSFVLLANHAITQATLVLLNLLYVIGPFMVAGGAFGGGATLHAWGRSLFQVLRWPIFPCFVVLVNAHWVSNFGVAADNVALALCNNIILALLVFSTPLVVSMLVSQGGVAALGALAWGLAMSKASQGWKALTGGGQSAGETHDEAAPQSSAYLRPDDAPRPVHRFGEPLASREAPRPAEAMP